MKITPRLMKFLLNIYGPYLGAGVHIDSISADWRTLQVSMKLRWYNRNIYRVHFGGSLYSMVDPHLVLMYMHILGPAYTVWDKSAKIEFLRPGKGRVTAEISVSENSIEEVRAITENGEPFLPKHVIEVKNERNKTVAMIHKELFVRKNP